MNKELQHLDLIISSQESQKEKGNLTPTGAAYLDGLKRAKNILFGDIQPSEPYRQVPVCTRCSSSNTQEGPQFHKCLSCGNIFT